MNQVGLVGRITRDPVLKTLSENRLQTSFVVAINRNFRNNQGAIDADFVQCIAWGKLADRITQYCGKGSLIGINGRLQSRTYTTKENTRVFSTEVVVDDVRFYILKTPIGSSNTKQETGKIAENQGIEENFVLPKQEEALPIP